MEETTAKSTKLVQYALEHTPSLILDCANVADPHLYYPYHDETAFEETYVIPIDLLYKFRDSLKSVDDFVVQKNIDVIVVTSYQRLFHYDNDIENELILQHCFDLLEQIDSYVDDVIVQTS